MVDPSILLSAAEIFGTPFYLYDLDFIRDRVRRLYDFFSQFDFQLAYAVKANFNIDILSMLNELGTMVDVVSFGEYGRVRKAGFTPDRIVVNGNCKSASELKHYVEDGVFCINLDSLEELLRLQSVVDRPVRVAIRVNPDVDPKTHHHIATGLKENKFGVDYETAETMVRIISKSKFIQLVGLHCHIGSQIVEVGPYKEAFESMKSFASKLDLDLELVNLGGGWGINYGDGRELDLEEYRKTIFPILESFNCKILLELGRWIVGPAGYLVSKVEYVKKTKNKTLIVIDAGMSHLIRPALYGARHRIEPLYSSNGRATIVADVVGPVCESADTFAKGLTLPQPQEGEYVVIRDVGAYGYVMSSHYNLLRRAPEVLYCSESGFRLSSA
ncbi:diaminopimelate decarboxylase [Thermotoga sp. Ku-13t]|uniref:diaminopimelate decarboxylase n=1 Tax=Thermotoga sp. Ku-13t TaxID=1755813 RepID=UPI0013ED232A|nr:diaminopimelate decarboxylase [Thermotoga sp. Ku-13t]KAF2958684.1 diaminopimelate decarboxylase [Thermotoga sp. Ku-13t]